MPIRDIGLARTSDIAIFQRAQVDARILISKDRDFAELVTRLGPPPAIILLTCGNTSTDYLKGMLRVSLARALQLISEGEALVEIGGG